MSFIRKAKGGSLMKYFQVLIGVVLLASLAACSGSKPSKEEGEKAAAEVPENMVTGEQMTEDYVALLCQKYEDCGIQAFTDGEDCKNRIRALLTQDPQWKDLRLDKEQLGTCLADFKGLSCDNFKTGQSPESCDKLSS